MQQRPEDLSGDYEYDLAHEGTGGAVHEQRRDELVGPAPAARPVEFGQDLSYDEAHDF